MQTDFGAEGGCSRVTRPFEVRCPMMAEQSARDGRANRGGRPRRRGVVAVVYRPPRFLVIRRSIRVAAPGAYCFPGGAIEPGEDEPAALVRELHEELAAVVKPVRRLWESVTPWNVHLAWWRAELAEPTNFAPNPDEVDSVHWLTAGEMLDLAELLDSNRAFLAAIARGEIFWP
jgi:8-oxo-dGTP diphosphatase